MIEKIQQVQQEWGAHVVAMDAERLMQLYAPNAVLKPTLSAHIRRTPDDVSAYFVGSEKFGDAGFLSNRFKEVRWVESQPQIHGDIAFDTGKYAFVRQDGEEVTADFTFVYVRTPEGWKIATQHSSLEYAG